MSEGHQPQDAAEVYIIMLHCDRQRVRTSTRP